MEKEIWSRRLMFALRNTGVHLLISIFIAAATALLVFRLWYPYPYDHIIGGLDLYGILICVDMVCGPLLTLILSDPKKSKWKMTGDLGFVVLIQLAALLYGLHTVAVIRPVTVAFETDRFAVVSANQVVTEKLHLAPQSLQQVPWFGVRRVALREPATLDQYENVMLSLSGVPPTARPDWWQLDGKPEHEKIAKAMKPVSELIARKPQYAEQIALAVKQAGLPESELYYLPFTGERVKEWIVLMDKQTSFKAFAAVDGF